jgi:hypothetical protein
LQIFKTWSRGIANFFTLKAKLQFGSNIRLVKCTFLLSLLSSLISLILS